jgi:MFS transporter, MHS family, shikimate and dehydroshikimate transport protein
MSSEVGSLGGAGVTSPGKRVVISSYVGSVIEWFDFFIYSVATASVFNVLFFPTETSGVGTLLALSTLAVGYVVRPLGGMIYGHFGDRVGRKKMLVSSILLMGIATVLIGMLPTYQQIGIFAPILLICLRILQGLAVAGEWGGALLMTVEHADNKRRGLWSSVIGMGQCSGLLLGTLVFGLISRLPQEDFLAWGWRLPFIGAAVLVLLGLWMRLGIEESPVFEAQRQREKVSAAKKPAASPMLDTLKSSKKQVAQTFLIVSGPFIVSAIISPFSIAYSVDLGFARAAALDAASVAALFQIVGMFTGGYISDRIGRRPVFMVGAFAMAAGLYALLTLATSKDPHLLMVGFGLAGLAHGFMFGPIGAFIAELFPTRNRFTGASLGYQLAGTLGGGFAPVIASSLLLAAGGAPNVGYVLAFACTACLVSFIVAISSRETYRDDLLQTTTT